LTIVSPRKMPSVVLAGMPQPGANEDIEATFVAAPNRASTRLRMLTCSSWNYLQHGITRIMNNLQDGLDLQTVRFPSRLCFLEVK
jgi:hypothetical protein